MTRPLLVGVMTSSDASAGGPTAKVGLPRPVLAKAAGRGHCKWAGQKAPTERGLQLPMEEPDPARLGAGRDDLRWALSPLSVNQAEAATPHSLVGVQTARGMTKTPGRDPRVAASSANSAAGRPKSHGNHEASKPT